MSLILCRSKSQFEVILGAHVCGFAGKINKFKRISGLDPAGPEFWGKIDRLNATDAE